MVVAGFSLGGVEGGGGRGEGWVRLQGEGEVEVAW